MLNVYNLEPKWKMMNLTANIKNTLMRWIGKLLRKLGNPCRLRPLTLIRTFCRFMRNIKHELFRKRLVHWRKNQEINPGKHMSIHAATGGSQNGSGGRLNCAH